jgi:hypothetical protein
MTTNNGRKGENTPRRRMSSIVSIEVARKMEVMVPSMLIALKEWFSRV